MKILLLSLILIFCIPAYGQIKISGIVSDALSGDQIPGAFIKELGTENKTKANLNGEFAFTVSNSESILEVNFVGFRKKEIKIGDKRYFEIVLKPDCYKDFFDYDDIGLGFSSGVLNNPVGGFGYINPHCLF